MLTMRCSAYEGCQLQEGLSLRLFCLGRSTRGAEGRSGRSRRSQAKADGARASGEANESFLSRRLRGGAVRSLHPKSVCSVHRFFLSPWPIASESRNAGRRRMGSILEFVREVLPTGVAAGVSED